MAPGTHKRVHAEAATCDGRRKPRPNKKIRLDLEVRTPTTTIRETISNSKPESNETPIKTTPKPSPKIKRSAGNQKMTASPREHEAVQGEKADVHDHPETTQSEKADVQDPPEAIQCEKTPTLNKQTPDAAEEAPTPHTPSHSQGQLVALRGQGPGQQV